MGIDEELKRLRKERSVRQAVLTRHSNSVIRYVNDNDFAKANECWGAYKKAEEAWSAYEESHKAIIEWLTANSVDLDTDEQVPATSFIAYEEMCDRYGDWAIKVDEHRKLDATSNGLAHNNSTRSETLEPKVGNATTKVGAQVLDPAVLQAIQQVMSSMTVQQPQVDITRILAEQEKRHEEQMSMMQCTINTLSKELESLRVERNRPVASSPVKAKTSHRRVTIGAPDGLTIVGDAAGDVSQGRDASFRSDTGSALGMGRTTLATPTMFAPGTSHQPVSNPSVPVHAHYTGVSNRTGCFDDVSFTQKLLEQSTLQHKSLLASMRAPALSIPKFSGTPLEYVTFMNAFDELVDSSYDNPRAKLTALLAHCEGPARVAIASCAHQPAEEGYQNARLRLKRKFGNGYVVSQAWMNKVMDYGPLNTPELMDAFSTDLQCCKNSLETLGYLSELTCTNSLRLIVVKLPFPLRNRWRKMHRERVVRNGESAIDVLIELVSDAAADLGDPAFGEATINRARNTYSTAGPPNSRMHGSYSSRRGAVNVLHDGAADYSDHDGEGSAESYSVSRENASCVLCRSMQHFTSKCRQYKELNPIQRKEMVIKRGLCIMCLSPNHKVESCPLPWKCQDRQCGKRHHTSLHSAYGNISGSTMATECAVSTHDEELGEEIEDECLPQVTFSDSSAYLTVSAPSLPLTPVMVYNGGRKVLTYALLDNGSTLTLCTGDLVRRLELKPKGRTKVNMGTVSGRSEVSGLVVDFEVSGSRMDHILPVRDAVTVPSLPISLEQMAMANDMERWEHLKSIPLERIDASSVDLLVGQTNAHLLEHKRKVKRGDFEPYAILTPVGWTIYGRRDTPIEESCFHISAADVITEDTTSVMESFWKLEAVPDVIHKSKEDKIVLERWERECTVEDNHIVLPIPFIVEPPDFPDNYIAALRSLQSLGKRLMRNLSELEQFKTAMFKNFDGGHAEYVTSKTVVNLRYHWFLIYHDVDHPRKPGVKRIVKNGGAKFKGRCLNSAVYQGPDLINLLVAILLRFRQYAVASISDIDGMFNMVKVPVGQRDCMSFLFWKDGDPNKEIVICRMTTHIFGTNWAPSAAAFALRKTTELFGMQAADDVVRAILEQFYVDDWLNSEPTVSKSVEVIKGVRSVLAQATLMLGKFGSNSREVLSTIEVERRAKDIARIDLGVDKLPRAVTLGLGWDQENDTFGFSSAMEPRPLTRRGLVSCVSSLYDPLGLLTPYILPAKLLMQQVCRAGKAWDDNLDEATAEQWGRWLADVSRLDNTKMPRWFGSTEDTVNTLHHFGDASGRAYGVASYTVVYDPKTDVTISVIAIGKSRLAPTKTLTMPRMELCAAVLAVRVDLALSSYLTIRLEKSRFWSDSSIVLYYILGEPADFDTFEANRISFIQQHSRFDQWGHVPSELNPADLASRGAGPDALVSDLWTKGPAFICGPRTAWPPMIIAKKDEAPGRKKKKPVYMTQSWMVQTRSRSKVEAVWPESVVKESKRDVQRLKTIDERAPRKSRMGAKWPSDGEKPGRGLEQSETTDKHVPRKNKMEAQWPGSVKRSRCDVKRLERISEVANASPRSRDDMLKLVTERYSSYEKSVRLVAWLTRFRMCLRNKRWILGDLSCAEYRAAESKLVQLNQDLYLSDAQKKSRSFVKLFPRDIGGVLRVGGRLANSLLTEDLKHPYLVPARSPLAKTILSEAHTRVGHAGVDRTFAQVRNKFWLLEGRAQADSLRRQCIMCARIRGKPSEQLMGDLQASRTAAYEPPFTHTGTDLFGPITVTVRRRHEKRYGAIFTCMTVRAVHLEVVSDLSTSSFLEALERFVNHRGKPKSLKSDNGTNFVGGRKEVKRVEKIAESGALRKLLVKEGIDWSTNSPAASHQGGVWERQIRVVRELMMGLLVDQGITPERLQTVFCMIEGIINSRPLTRINDDPESFQPITPGHLLNLRGLVPVDYARYTSSRLHKDWRQAMYLSDQFWNRWVKFYLPSLQVRQKWNSPKDNLRTGELVLLIKDTMSRAQWPLAIVTEVFPGKDGRVRNTRVKTVDGEYTRSVCKLVRMEDDIQCK